MEKIKIIYPLSLERWEEYKDLRLAAVFQDPPAFGLTTEEELLKSDTDWIKRLQPDAQVKLLFAEYDGELVGMIGIYKETYEKIKHTSKLLSFFVDHSFRGKSIGKKLLEEALAFIKKDSDAKKVVLNVTATQDVAIGLYKKFGFKTAGTLSREILWGNRYYDQYFMECFL